MLENIYLTQTTHSSYKSMSTFSNFKQQNTRMQYILMEILKNFILCVFI